MGSALTWRKIKMDWGSMLITAPQSSAPTHGLASVQYTLSLFQVCPGTTMVPHTSVMLGGILQGKVEMYMWHWLSEVGTISYYHILSSIHTQTHTHHTYTHTHTHTHTHTLYCTVLICSHSLLAEWTQHTMLHRQAGIKWHWDWLLCNQNISFLFSTSPNELVQ